VHRPFPTRLVDSASDGQAADSDELETTFLERTNLIGSFTMPEINAEHDIASALDPEAHCRCLSMAASTKHMAANTATSRTWVPVPPTAQNQLITCG
jgi:hypothetical protein